MRRFLDARYDLCMRGMLLMAVALAGCAIDTAPPAHAPLEWPDMRWQREAVTVCADPALEDVTIAAVAAWTVGPELVYAGSCGDADVVVLPGGPWKNGAAAQTVPTFRSATGELLLAEIFVAPESGGYDRQSVLTHELGHAIGLPDVDVREATMFRWIAPHDIGPRDLAQHDIEAAQRLYGAR